MVDSGLSIFQRCSYLFPFGLSHCRFACGAELSGYAVSFFYGEDAVERRQLHLFNGSARPVNFDFAHCCCIAQAEVDALVVRGHVAAAAKHVSTLTDTVGGEINGRSNGIARTFGAADELEFDPMVAVGVDVAEEHRRSVKRVDDDIDLAVVEEVAKGCAPAGRDDGEAGALDRRNKFELFPPEVAIKQRALGKACAPVLF